MERRDNKWKPGYFNKKYFKALETFFDRNPWGKMFIMQLEHKTSSYKCCAYRSRS